MNRAIDTFVDLMRDESGQDLIEYAIAAGLVGLGAVASMTGPSTKTETASTQSEINSPTPHSHSGAHVQSR
jgi:pilus assembly protein Flp/PilA